MIRHPTHPVHPRHGRPGGGNAVPYSPTLTLISNVGNVWEVDASDAGTIFGAFSAAPIETGAAIEAGTGAASTVTYEVEAGVNSDEITAPTGPFAGHFQIVLKDALARYSNILRDDVDIPAQAPVYPDLVATASTTGATATIPSGRLAGDLIVVVADNVASTMPADVAGWTKVGFSSGISRLAYYHKVSDGTETTLATVNGARCHAAVFRDPDGTPTIGNVTNLTISNSTTAQLPANTGFTGAAGTSRAFRSLHRRSEYTEAQRNEGPSGYTRIGSLPATGTSSGLTAYISDADVASASAWVGTNTSGAFNTIGITMEIRAPV